MNRFTEDKYNCDSYSLKELNMPAGTQYLAIQKLGKLEDIEDELGIELITLFKAFSNGVWCSYFEFGKRKLIFIKDDYVSCLDLKEKKLVFDQEKVGVTEKLSNYGKTWALTKEELE